MPPNWRLSIGKFSQIWLQAKYESNQKIYPSIFLATLFEHFLEI
jgi:hypothetical protein